LLAALILVSGKELLRANVGGQIESLYLAIYAIVLILIALFRPKGLASLLQQAWSKLSSRAAKE
jgi:ABC-type branched-subunit amino acid transport system permease subunit